MAPSGQNRPREGGRGRGRGRDASGRGGRGRSERGPNPGRGDGSIGGAAAAARCRPPPAGEIPDFDGGFVFVARETITKEAFDKGLIGMGEDGAFIFEKDVKSTNTAVFICTVNDDGADHRVMLDFFMPSRRAGAPRGKVFSRADNSEPIDPDAFTQSQRGMPAQIKVRPWPMGAVRGAVRGADATTTTTLGPHRYLPARLFGRYLGARLAARLVDEGADEMPVTLDADEARELAWALVQATGRATTGATPGAAGPGEVAVRVRQKEKRDHPESVGGAAGGGGRTVTVARDGRLVQVPVLRIAPEQLSQQKVTTDLDIALDRFNRDDATRIAALKAIGAACQGAGGPGMFRDGYDWDRTNRNFRSETKFEKLAKGLRSLEHDRVREIRTLAPAVLGTAACAYIRGYAVHSHHSGLRLSVPHGKSLFTLSGKFKPPNPSDKKAWKRFVDEEYTPARNAVWERERRVREGEIPGDSTTFRDLDAHFFGIMSVTIAEPVDNVDMPDGSRNAEWMKFQVEQKEFAIEAMCACLAPLMDAILDAKVAVDVDGDDASIVRHSNMLHILWQRIPPLLKSCVSMLYDSRLDEDVFLPMFRLFSILTRDLTIKSLFLDDVSARWTEEGSLPAGDTSKTFPSMRINVAAKEFDLPWRHRHAVTFQDFVDAIVPLACCDHRLDGGSRGINCWVEACELLSKFKHKWNRPTSTQRAHHRKLLHRLMQYCIESDEVQYANNVQYGWTGIDPDPIAVAHCFRSCMGDICETAWEEATSFAYALMSHAVRLKNYNEKECDEYRRSNRCYPDYDVFWGIFIMLGSLLDRLLNGSGCSGDKLAQLEKATLKEKQTAMKTVADKWKFLQEQCVEVANSFVYHTFPSSFESRCGTNAMDSPETHAQTFYASLEGMLACLRFHNWRTLNPDLENIDLDSVPELPFRLGEGVFRSVRRVSQSNDPETALCGKMAYLEAAKSSNVAVRLIVSRTSRILFKSDLALIKTSLENKNTRTSIADIEALVRAVDLDLDVFLCLWNGSDETKIDHRVRSEISLLLHARLVPEQIIKSNPVLKPLIDKFITLKWKMDLFDTADGLISDQIPDFDSKAEALLLPALDPDTADGKTLTALRTLLEDKASAKVYMHNSEKIFDKVRELAEECKDPEVRIAAAELLVDPVIIPPDDWNAEIRIIWNVHRTALRCIGDKVKIVRDKWAAALPGLSLAAAWRTGKNLCDTPQWVTSFALAARRANFQSADLKSILDALMSKDVTKMAPATIRKMLDRAVKVAPPPTRQGPVAASLTSVGGTLLNAAAADRAAMRGAVETPAVRESEPAPMDVDSEKDSDSSIDLNAISINDDAAMWWAVQETARQCVSARLRTHYGNASETLSFIEQSLREVRHTKTPTVAGAKNVPRKNALSMTGTWLLLEFVQALERQMYNAYEGTLSLPPPGKSAASFFRLNKQICVDWLRRIKEASLGAAKSCGNVAVGANISLSRVQGAFKTLERRVEKAARQRAEAPARHLELKNALSEANARLSKAHKRHGLVAARLERARQLVSERMNTNKSNQEIDKAREKVDELREEVKDAKEEVSELYREKSEAQEKLKHFERKSAGEDTDSEKDAVAFVFRAISDAVSLLVSFGELDLLIGLADWCEPRLRSAGLDVCLPTSHDTTSDDAISKKAEGLLDWIRAAALEADGRHEQAAERYRQLLKTPAKIGSASVRAVAKRLTHAYASVCDWDGLDDWRKDLRNIQQDAEKAGSNELTSALKDVDVKPELLGAWANFDRSQLASDCNSLLNVPIRISEKPPASPMEAVDVLNHATQHYLQECFVRNPLRDPPERIANTRKQLQTAMKRMQEPMRLSNLMGSPGVTETLHLELATADLVCAAKRDQYHRLFGASPKSHGAVQRQAAWIKLCRVLNALSLKNGDDWSRTALLQIPFASTDDSPSARLLKEILSCAEKRGNFVVVCKILSQAEGSRDPQSSAQLDLESAWFQLGELFEGEFIERCNRGDDSEDVFFARFESTMSFFFAHLDAHNVDHEEHLMPFYVGLMEAASLNLCEKAPNLEAGYKKFTLALTRVLHNLEEHFPVGLRRNVEPRKGALLKKVANWDLFGDRHDENAKVWLEYARFFDDFYRRDIDDANDANDPNGANDPAPWGPKRRDRHPISVAGVEDIDGVCGDPTPLDRGADVKEVTHLLEVANAYAQYLVRNKSLDRDTELDRHHAMVRLLDLATSQQIGERDEMNKIFQEIPTLTFGDFIPELINLLHSDVRTVRENATAVLVRVAKEIPRALSYAIAVEAAAADDEADAANELAMSTEDIPEALAAVRERFASASRALEAIGRIKSVLNIRHPRLFADVTLMVSELGRLAVLHDEELLTSLQELHGDVTRRIASIPESFETLGDSPETLELVMRPAVVELDRLVREALSGTGFVTPHVKSFARKYREGLLNAADQFRRSIASDPSAGWRAVKEQMAHLARGLQRKRELRLKNLSPSLAKLETRVGGFTAPMPVGFGVDIVSVGSDVTVLPTKSRPKRITLLGSDGDRRMFLLKGKEDLRLDARLMRFGEVVNAALFSDEEARRRRLRYSTYSVTPLAGNSGLIQWVENATPMSAVFAGWQRRTRAASALPPPGAVPDDWRPADPPEASKTRPLDLFYARVSAALRAAGVATAAKRREWPADVLHDTVQRMRAEVPQDFLQRELWCGAPTSAAWLLKSMRHARSVATASVVGHLVGLGDRHLDNVLVNLATGDVVHIDYNVSFDRGLTLPVPEVVPFRLTPVAVAALGPTETHGPFRCAAETALAALRRPSARQALLGALELLTREPLMDWIDDGAGPTGRGTGRKHARRGDLAREHQALDIAAGLESFAAKIRESAPQAGSVCGYPSVFFELAVDVDEILAELRGRAAEDGAAVIAAAEAAEAAEAARLDARDAAAEAAQASDAEEFSASGVSNSNLDDAIRNLSDHAADARSWSDRHGRALDRLAPAVKTLSELRNRTTTTADTGGAPMLRAAPLAASLALSRELQDAAGKIDVEGGGLIAARDGATDAAAAALERYNAWVTYNLPPSYPESDRRAVWAKALEEARDVSVRGSSGLCPGSVRDAVETFRRLVDEARAPDESGAISWARYCAATGAWHERESRTLPWLRADVDDAAKECERHAAAGSRRWDQSFRQTVYRVFRDTRSEIEGTKERPALSWLAEYASRARVRAGRADDPRTEPPPGSSEPSAEPRAFAPSSSSGFFGDMDGDGEELGGLSDDEDDDGSLEDELSKLRVEEDLDIGDDESGGTLEERFAAMPSRERSAVLAAAVYGAFNSKDYPLDKRDIYVPEDVLPRAAFIDSVMDAAMLPHRVMKHVLPVVLDPRAVDPMRSMRIVEAARAAQALEQRAFDPSVHSVDYAPSSPHPPSGQFQLACELQTLVESLAEDAPVLSEALLTHVCRDTLLFPGGKTKIDGKYVSLSEIAHPMNTVKALSKLVTRVLAAYAANVSGDLREENIVNGEHDIGGKQESVVATVLKEAEEAADVIDTWIVKESLKDTVMRVTHDLWFPPLPSVGQDGDFIENPNLEQDLKYYIATKDEDAMVTAMLDAALKAMCEIRRSGAEADLARCELTHAASDAAISRAEWLLESRLERGSNGRWGVEADPARSRRWRSKHLDDVATAGAELAAADIAVRDWSRRAAALERSVVEFFQFGSTDPDRMDTFARSLEDRARALRESDQRAATCRQLCEAVESFERCREPEREAAAESDLLPEGFLDFSFDAALDEDDETGDVVERRDDPPKLAASGIARNPFKRRGDVKRESVPEERERKPAAEAEATRRSKKSNRDVAGGWEKTYELAIEEVILACEEVLETASASAGPEAEAAAVARAEAAAKAERARELARLADEKSRAVVDDVGVAAFVEPRSRTRELLEELREAMIRYKGTVRIADEDENYVVETGQHLEGLNAVFAKAPTDLAEACDVENAEHFAGAASDLLREFKDRLAEMNASAKKARQVADQALCMTTRKLVENRPSPQFVDAVRWLALGADVKRGEALRDTATALRDTLTRAQESARNVSIAIKEHTGLGLTATEPRDDDAEKPTPRIEQPVDSSDDDDDDDDVASASTTAAATTTATSDAASERRRGSAPRRWRGGRHPTAVRLISVVAAKLAGRPKLVEALRRNALASVPPTVPSPPGGEDALAAAAIAETPLTAKEDVDRLVAEATDARRLASMYEGWCPWL